MRLNDLVNQYEGLAADLRRGGPQDSWWTNFKRELGTLVEIHRAERPALNPEARYNRAILLIRLGRYAEARAALGPFARGEVEPAGYRQTEAGRLVERLARYE